MTDPASNPGSGEPAAPAAGIDEFDQTPPAAGLTAAARSFNGIALAPYSYGRRLLWRSLFGNVDEAADQIASLSLIFTLTRRDEAARDFLFNVPAFKTAFGRWLDERAKGDYSEALALADVILAEAKAAEVRPAEDPGGLPKKKP